MLNVYSKIRTFDDSIISDLEEVIKTTFNVKLTIVLTLINTLLLRIIL